MPVGGVLRSGDAGLPLLEVVWVDGVGGVAVGHGVDDVLEHGALVVRRRRVREELRGRHFAPRFAVGVDWEWKGHVAAKLEEVGRGRGQN